MKYVLTLSPDYVKDWGFWPSCRELLQNSIDQCRADANCSPIFTHSPASQTLSIGTTNCRLDPKTLLMGMSNKRGDSSMIGQYGEGYKLAMLVLVRNSYEVTIYNNDTIWTPCFEHSDLYDEDLLTINIKPNPNPTRGVVFAIRDVSTEAFGSIHENYLMDELDDKIFFEDYMKGKVFCGGLFVCNVEELWYGYNFAPGKIRLDRDRSMCNHWEVQHETAQLWERSGQKDKLYDCMKENAFDTRGINWLPEETSDYVKERFIEEHPNALPVATQGELDRFRGTKTQLVSQTFRNILRKAHEFVFNRQGSPSERLETFKRQFKNQLNVEARRELNAMIDDSKAWSEERVDAV